MSGERQLGFGWDEDAAATGEQGRLAGIVPLADRLRALADKGVHLGTSSWKYQGWLGQVYNPAHYLHHGKISKSKFERECLTEYATVFPTVGGDFSFYQFPSEAYWQRLFEQVPSGFLFGLKVPEEVTVEQFPTLPRYGQRAGTPNAGFMDASLLEDRFLGPLEPYREKIGVLMFEFGRIHRSPLSEISHFVDALDAFLSRLPTDRFRFAVEVRNRGFLDKEKGEYLSCLTAREVAHCLNSWTRMPPVREQLEDEHILTATHVAARFLLKPGRTYQQAVDQFAPYERVQEPYPGGRHALRELIEHCLTEQRTLFAYVNNRFEGNAVGTIETVVNEIA